MVATALSGSIRTWLWPAAALVAFSFLLWFAVAGTRPEDKHLIKPEGTGLLTVAPETIREVIVRTAHGEQRFTRLEGVWRDEARAQVLDAAASKRLDVAVKIMKTSPPVREMTAEEIGRSPLSEFGLDAPRVVVMLRDSSENRLRLELGKTNPQNLLRYARINGTASVYLYSGFVGEEWEAVAGIAAPVQR